jgi:hypothetical protein
MLAVCREIDDMLIELGTTTETTRLRINANKTVSHLGSEIDAEIGTVYYDLLCKIRDELRDLVNDDSYVLDDE